MVAVAKKSVTTTCAITHSRDQWNLQTGNTSNPSGATRMRTGHFGVRLIEQTTNACAEFVTKSKREQRNVNLSHTYMYMYLYMCHIHIAAKTLSAERMRGVPV